MTYCNAVEMIVYLIAAVLVAALIIGSSDKRI